MTLKQDLLEIEPLNEDEFLKVRETLTRMGIPFRDKTNKNAKPTLWQSCHILHKQGRYYIVHFKELFLLDGKGWKTDFKEEDAKRTRFIAYLLTNWGLVKPINPLKNVEEVKITIIPFKDKNNWNLKAKYNVGKKIGESQ